MNNHKYDLDFCSVVAYRGGKLVNSESTGSGVHVLTIVNTDFRSFSLFVLCSGM